MSGLTAKISSLREKVTGALEDVPDNLIGFLVILLVLTGVGLGILMFFGYQMTR